MLGMRSVRTPEALLPKKLDGARVAGRVREIGWRTPSRSLTRTRERGLLPIATRRPRTLTPTSFVCCA